MGTILPPNATQLEKDIESVIETRYDAIEAKLRDTWNPDTCPAAFLPWLAWAFSVDVWDTEWTTQKKRSTIKAAFGIHQKKGTPNSVKNAVAALGGSTVLTEWHQQSPAGTPNTFTLLINYAGQEVTAGFQDSIITAIERTKRLSQDYTVATGINGSGSLNMLGFVRLATFQRFTFEDINP